MKKFCLLTMFLSILFCSCNKFKKASTDSANFIFVCPIINNEYWQLCIKGIERADSELGTKTTIIGPHDETNFATEIIDYMEKAVRQKPDGIMAYSGIEAMYPLINQAEADGIPVISIGSDAPKTNRLAYVGTDVYDCGYKMGEEMIRLTNGKAKIGFLISSLSAENEITVFHAFKDAIMDFDMEVVAIEETDANPDTAEQKTRGMLKAHPEMNAMFNTAGYNVTGAARVKQEKNLDIKLIGFDDVPENLAFVRAGVINTLFVQNVEEMGYRSVYLLKEYLEEGQLARDIYSTGVTIVTKDNVDSYRAK